MSKPFDLRSILKLFVDNFNFTYATVGASVMGAYVFWLNRKYGFEIALVPALKQFGYTFFIGGGLTRLTQRMCIAYPSKRLSIFLAIFTPTIISAVLIAFIHVIKGTPNPVYTILWTLVAVPPGFIYVALITRYKHDKQLAEE